MKHIFTMATVVVIASLSLVMGSFASEEHGHEDAELSEETRSILHDIRHETASFHDVTAATEAGYGEFLDCFRNGDLAAQGLHFVNGDLVGDDLLDPLTPEALVYEKGTDGDMVLVALEYLVFADVWDPEGSGREAPTLLGQEFHLETEIPDTPAVWALHVWLWAHNPDGLYASFNPTVFCRNDEGSIDMAMADS